MNHPESSSKFTPKQALSPTPALYAELVGDGMEQLAAASMSCVAPLLSGTILHDVGCGLGAATAAAVAIANTKDLSIKGTDINDGALDIYRRTAAEKNWPAEGLRMDAAALEFPDETFTHAIGNALLFVLPNDGIDAMKEVYRTLKPGGVAIFNSWAYVPTLPAIEAAAKSTRPVGTPLPRQGLEKWESADFIKKVVVEGGFSPDNVTLTKRHVYVTVGDIHHFATMLWSFIAGTSSAGWLESDEENWERAVGIVAEELEKTDGYERLDEEHSKFKFVANIAVAVK
jgi:SAM-dependent methyltransferase